MKSRVIRRRVDMLTRNINVAQWRVRRAFAEMDLAEAEKAYASLDSMILTALKILDKLANDKKK